jgi:predicted phosphodiesterase
MQTQQFTWLHLTDLHFGLNGQPFLWPNLRVPFFDDLAKLHQHTGNWDAVLFTGDLVQQGKSDEFAKMQAEFLDRLWKTLDKLGSGNAKLLAVPGNHDLFRPDPDDNPAVENLLKAERFSEIADQFWNKPNGTYRNVITEAFAAYRDWWQENHHRPKDIRSGLLPGDFACTLPCNGLNIGIVGLNTAFLQLQGGDYQGKLVWDVRQLHSVCDDVGDWRQQHDFCLLLTHHGMDWLTKDAQQHGDSEIAPPDRFAVHLFGHMHEHALTAIRRGGNPNTTRLAQGCSIFGMDKFGEPPTEQRSHGYAAGQITLENGEASAARQESSSPQKR